MKTLSFLLTLFFGLIFLSLQAQVPNKFNYQAMAKKLNGNPITGNIEVFFTILEGNGSTVLYKEKHDTAADGYGLFNLQIGDGSPLSGAWTDINWGEGAGKKLKVEIKPSGGALIDMGAQDLVSVPFAMNAAGLSLPYYETIDAGGADALVVTNNNGYCIKGVSLQNGDGLLGLTASGPYSGISGVTTSSDVVSNGVFGFNGTFGTSGALGRGPYSGYFSGGPVNINVPTGAGLELYDPNGGWGIAGGQNLHFIKDGNYFFNFMSDGHFGINTLPGPYSFKVYQFGAYGIDLEYGSYDWELYVGATGNLNFYRNSGANSAYLSASGFWTNSDMRYKKDWQPLPSILGKVKKLNPVSYKMLSDPSGKEVFGFLAQELQEVFPQVVEEADGKTDEKMLAVNYGEFGVIAIKAIQEQQQLIETLTQRIDALEQKVLELEKQ